MKEDIIAANLNSIRQSIEELKKNNSSQSYKNVPNWDELENKIAQAAANEVRILLEKRQQKFKEEEKQRKAETEAQECPTCQSASAGQRPQPLSSCYRLACVSLKS